MSAAAGVHVHIIGDANEAHGPRHGRRQRARRRAQAWDPTVLHISRRMPLRPHRDTVAYERVDAVLELRDVFCRKWATQFHGGIGLAEVPAQRRRAEPVLADGRRDVLGRVLGGVGPPSIPIYCNVYFVADGDWL